MKFLGGVYVRMMNRISEWKVEQRGSQTLEWLGIAAVVVIIVGVISQAFGGEGNGIGETIKNKFSQFINEIGKGE
jgi:hypothetical protein